MTIKIKDLSVKNFMSVGNVTQAVDFNREQLTLVLGENLDQGGDDSGSRNGTGKTTIINGLSYALYGQALTNIKRNNLINKTNGKGMLVTLNFEKNGVEYRVERGRSPNVLRFFVNGIEKSSEITDESQGDSRETQKDINELLGLSHNMFKHIVALNTYTEPFLSLKTNEQREIIEQLLGITVLSERADRIKELNKATKDSITSEEFRVRAVQEANKRIEEQIESLRRRQGLWQKKYDSDLAYLVGQYDDLTRVNIEAELLAHKELALWNERKKQADAHDRLLAYQTAWQQTQAKEVSGLQDSYNKLSHIDIVAELQAHQDLAAYNQRAKDIAELEKLIARCVADDAREQKTSDKLRAEIAELEAHKCYACGQEFHDGAHETVLEAKRKLLQESALQALATNGQWIENTAPSA